MSKNMIHNLMTPAFSKLFYFTSINQEEHVLIFTPSSRSQSKIQREAR